jgi:ATP-dependent protease Clp ATPase subunit
MTRVQNCSFCGRVESEVGDLIPGMKASICAECLGQISHFPINTDASANCGFCGRNQKEVPKLASGKTASICTFCAEAMLHPSVLARSGFIINPRTRVGSWLLNSNSRFIRKYVLGEP